MTRLPRGFLWRHYYKLYAEGEAATAEVRTSRLLLRFLRNVWLGVAAEAAGRRGDDLFVPEYFFDDALALRGERDPFAADVARSYTDFVAGQGAQAS